MEEEMSLVMVELNKSPGFEKILCFLHKIRNPTAYGLPKTTTDG
jgi:hypothetical protein